MVYAFRERGPQAVTVSAEPGAQRPLHCTAVGKAYLAALPAAEGESLLSSLELKTYRPQTVTFRKQLSSQLSEIRARGWSEDYQEYEPASICLWRRDQGPHRAAGRRDQRQRARRALSARRSGASGRS